MSGPPAPVAFADVHVLTVPAADDAGAVDRIRRMAVGRGMPLVLCSPRTRAELEHRQQEFDLPYPFICENGGALYVPDGYFGFPVPEASKVRGYEVVTFGPPYRAVVEALRRTADRLGIEVMGFQDLSIEDVAMECQLTLPQARLAKMREFGEPFRVAARHAHDRPRLFNALRKQGFGCIRGGRFDYVGASVDEVAGIDLLTECYERAFGSIVTIGVGDPSYDVRLLDRVQVPIVFRRQGADEDAIRKPQTAEFDAAPRFGPWRRVLRGLLPRASRTASPAAIRLVRSIGRSPDPEFWPFRPVAERPPIKPT